MRLERVRGGFGRAAVARRCPSASTHMSQGDVLHTANGNVHLYGLGAAAKVCRCHGARRGRRQHAMPASALRLQAWPYTEFVTGGDDRWLAEAAVLRARPVFPQSRSKAAMVGLLSCIFKASRHPGQRNPRAQNVRMRAWCARAGPRQHRGCHELASAQGNSGSGASLMRRAAPSVGIRLLFNTGRGHCRNRFDRGGRQ